MDNLFARRAPKSLVQLTTASPNEDGSVDLTTGAGDVYSSAPSVTGGNIPSGVDCLTLNIGRNAALGAIGGYAAPRDDG